jgi:hypothetical protein
MYDVIISAEDHIEQYNYVAVVIHIEDELENKLIGG